MIMKFLEHSFPHIYQHKAYNCGPTSIRIVLNHLGFPKTIDLEYLEEITGTNDITGCTDVNMKKGLDELGIKYIRIVDLPKEESFKILDTELNNQNLIILRTLTKGIKHWIVVYNLQNGIYKCSDPWLGKLQYSYDEINSIWEPRNYDAFIVSYLENKK